MHCIRNPCVDNRNPSVLILSISIDITYTTCLLSERLTNLSLHAYTDKKVFEPQ